MQSHGSTPIWLAIACFAFPLLLAAQEGANTGAAKPDKAMEAPSAEEILKKYVEASGGVEAYKKISSRVSELTFEIPMQGIKGNVKVFQKSPALSKTTVEIPQVMTQQEGTKGNVAWEVGQMGPRLKEPLEAGPALRTAHLDLPLRLAEFYPKRESKGVEKFGDKECYRVDCTPPEKGATAESYYFDKENNLLHGIKMKAHSPMGAMTIEIVSKDYKKVDGISMPFTMKQTYVELGVSMTMITTKVQHNVEISDSTFDYPPEIQKLLDLRDKKDDEKEGDGDGKRTEKVGK